ncbi:MAG: hypothetical protein A2284_04370 [Deltaproteobacteria bacterium RIFOXYA12_FULL_61_11]|nr:MAG: hypothetical protein A2284_04370 [Deltaproteobacteria bacterium RIFOXYA12_FULL_61_11]
MEHTCLSCGRAFKTLGAGRWACPYCATPLDPGPQVSPPLPPPAMSPPDDNIPPFEREGGFSLHGLIATWHRALFEPWNFFHRVRSPGGLTQPLVFGMVFSTLGWSCSLFYATFLGELGLSWLIENAKLQTVPQHPLNVPILVFLPIIPLLSVLGLLFSGLTHHILLIMVGAARRPLRDTLHTVCYARSAPAVLEVIPVAGGFLSWFWGTVTLIVGLAKTHEASYARVIAALLVPILLSLLMLVSVLTALVMATKGA